MSGPTNEEILPHVRAYVSCLERRRNAESDIGKKSYLGLYWSALEKAVPAHYSRLQYAGLFIQQIFQTAWTFLDTVGRVVYPVNDMVPGDWMESSFKFARNLTNVFLIPVSFVVSEVAALGGIISPKTINSVYPKARCLVLQPRSSLEGIVKLALAYSEVGRADFSKEAEWFAANCDRTVSSEYWFVTDRINALYKDIVSRPTASHDLDSLAKAIADKIVPPKGSPT